MGCVERKLEFGLGFFHKSKVFLNKQIPMLKQRVEATLISPSFPFFFSSTVKLSKNMERKGIKELIKLMYSKKVIN